MSTPSQIFANQRNAQASTGPKSPEGKSASSRNATKHGLAGTFQVLPHESQADFDRLLQRYCVEFQPRAENEYFFTLQMAQARWKLARFQRIEAAVVEKMTAEADPGQSPDAVIAAAMLEKLNNAFTALQRYSAAAERSYYKALRELTRGRAAEQKQSEDADISAIEQVMHWTPPPPPQSFVQNEPNSQSEDPALRL